MLRFPLTLPTYATLALLAGCGGLTAYYPDGRVDPVDTGDTGDTGDSGDTGETGDTGEAGDTGTLPLDVTEVDPQHGSTSGGTEVEIIGGPFDGSAEVFFGDQRATVQNTGQTWITAVTPRGTEGAATVRVVTDTHEGEAAGAFNYWADGSGLVGTYGSFSHTRYVGTYWCVEEPCVDETDLGTPESTASASIAFLSPGTLEWWQNWAPSFNQCASDYEPSLSADVYEPDVANMTLKRSSIALNLQQGTGEVPSFYYVTTGNVASSFINSSSYTLESRGSATWPAYEINGVVNTPGLFSITSPIVTGDTLPRVRRSSFRVAWNGSGGDYVVIRATRLGTTGSVLEEVTCVVDDIGSFTIPSNAWTGWSLDNQILLQVGRVKEPGGTVPFNNAQSGMVGVQWIVGAAVTQ